ncbi:unnamed protein product [Lathyrus sativus]|nr:unnamed protein product [Lathyrus sativus]
MLAAWNVRGLNNAGKLREIRSRLLELCPKIIALLETRVKVKNVPSVRNKLMLRGSFADNYQHHANGRVWLYWDSNEVDIKSVKSSSQFIYSGIHDLAGNFLFWLTTVYALNRPKQRRVLWNYIVVIYAQQQGPWVLMGDFDNVIHINDRIGGNDVTKTEYIDICSMMENVGLFEKESKGSYYTWSNNHTAGTIYSHIDHVLANVEWLQQNTDITLHMLPPSVSDHSLLFLTGNDQVHKRYRKPIFRFYNCIMDFEGYGALVENNWSVPIKGNPMFILWNKLMRLQPALRNFSKPARHNDQQLIQARNRLNTTQTSLEADPMNATIITRIKKQKVEIIKLQELEENILRQKSKLDWLKWGDGNNSYFHASVKAKNNSKNISQLIKEDGTILTVQADIEDEVLDYYKNLLGTADSTVCHIDVTAMRDGPQLNMEQRYYLLAPITEKEIHTALKGIGDLKSPGINGYRACFFKGSWETIQSNVVNAVHDFFRHERLFKAFNSTVVTLILKHCDAQSIKDYRPIAGCTTVYKIISKILTTRLGKVIGDVVHHSQAAFVPGQQIHNHILLAYELIKGYTRKGGTPRCMLQIDLQKAYDMVNWDALECIMKEIGIPNQFVRWIMITITSVTYKFNINGYHTKTIQAKRCIRQGDLIFPLLFVIIMEYLNRCFCKM